MKNLGIIPSLICLQVCTDRYILSVVKICFRQLREFFQIHSYIPNLLLSGLPMPLYSPVLIIVIFFYGLTKNSINHIQKYQLLTICTNQHTLSLRGP